MGTRVTAAGQTIHHRRSATRAGGAVLGHDGGGEPARREQPPDQLGPLAEAPAFGGSGGREIGLDLCQHPRQRDREGDEGSV
jgi:hypothetical protein